MKDERTKLEPRWLYVGAGTVVFIALASLAFLMLVLGFLIHVANNVMAGF